MPRQILEKDFSAKLKYRDRDGHITTAYIDDIRTGIGTNKYSSIPIVVSYDEETETWRQSDTWEWDIQGQYYVRRDANQIKVPIY